MPGRHRSNSEKIRDRRRVAELYLKGWLQADIAKELGRSQSTVGRDLVELRKQWLKSSLVDTDKAKAKELARIDNLEREAWDAWLRSQEDAETVTQRVYERNKKTVKEATKTSKGQTGDPRYLDRVSWCVQQRCKILGLEAPTKVAPTDPTGEKEYEGFSDRERLARIEALRKATQREDQGSTEG